jgi:aminopeptidase-like protein
MTTVIKDQSLVRNNVQQEHPYDFVRRLYPVCRSITGSGLRETLRLIRERLPELAITEVPTGTRVLDWMIPEEWNIRDAYIKNSAGERVVDFKQSNLHIVSYSVPVFQRMTLAELRSHLHTLPEHPDWIPFRTSYFRESWGFALTHRQYEALEEGEYEVCIDATLQNGALSYGEWYSGGLDRREVLISCHCCHPSLCNDNLSGIVVAVGLAERLSRRPHRYSYRFLFIPTTLGSLAWLAANEQSTSRIVAGLVLACVGDPGGFTYKKTRRGNALTDRASEYVLRQRGQPFTIREFIPYGYDERQFCSPAFDLPIGSLLRTPNGCFPEYHTSADDLTLVTPEALAGSLECADAILQVIDQNATYVNLSPKGEPQLGPRGLYPPSGKPGEPSPETLALLWVLNLSDGSRDLLAIAERAGLPFSMIRDAADSLERVGLLEEVPGQ